jgi:hypothetical protein
VAACQQGATCSNDTECDEEQGLLCVISRCDVPRDLGLPCGSDRHCKPEYRCEPDPADLSRRICSPRIADEQPCPFGGHSECASGFCDPFTTTCGPKAALGGSCPSSLDQQCEEGWCDSTFIMCVTDGECPDSMFCDMFAGRCGYYCAAPLAEGADCFRDEQCASGTCEVGRCRTLPIPDGQPCATDVACASGFCGLDVPRVCEQLPLADGRACAIDDQCTSGACFAGTCVMGLSQGDACGDPTEPSCARDLYCDYAADTPVCQPVNDAGAMCRTDDECRGECTEAWSRMMCEPTTPPAGAICDGV